MSGRNLGSRRPGDKPRDRVPRRGGAGPVSGRRAAGGRQVAADVKSVRKKKKVEMEGPQECEGVKITRGAKTRLDGWLWSILTRREYQCSSVIDVWVHALRCTTGTPWASRTNQAPAKPTGLGTATEIVSLLDGGEGDGRDRRDRRDQDTGAGAGAGAGAGMTYVKDVEASVVGMGGCGRGMEAGCRSLPFVSAN